jgi:hypothetical protein
MPTFSPNARSLLGTSIMTMEEMRNILDEPRNPPPDPYPELERFLENLRKTKTPPSPPPSPPATPPMSPTTYKLFPHKELLDELVRLQGVKNCETRNEQIVNDIFLKNLIQTIKSINNTTSYTQKQKIADILELLNKRKERTIARKAFRSTIQLGKKLGGRMKKYSSKTKKSNYKKNNRRKRGGMRTNRKMKTRRK